MPEVDAFIGLDQVANAGSIIEQILARPAAQPTPQVPGSGPAAALIDDTWEPLNLVTRKPVYIPDWDTPRFRLTPPHTAFTKIAEGCNHPC